MDFDSTMPMDFGPTYEHNRFYKRPKTELNVRSMEYTRPDTPLDKQVGGQHYKDMAIQPVEFILANELGFCEGNIIKYTCRYKQKGGIEDLRKVIHYAELLINKMEK